jgi:hypothetical protein
VVAVAVEAKVKAVPAESEMAVITTVLLAVEALDPCHRVTVPYVVRVELHTKLTANLISRLPTLK